MRSSALTAAGAVGPYRRPRDRLALQSILDEAERLSPYQPEYLRDRFDRRILGLLLIAAPVARVWQLLSDAPGWGMVDSNIHDIHLESNVTADARFDWAYGKARMQSMFAVVDPGREITWTGVAFGAKVIHRHLLTSADEGTTQIYTEESMGGPLFILFYNSTKLKTRLEKWLTMLKNAAET